jgi:long-chain acyl-CoA synthetase
LAGPNGNGRLDAAILKNLRDEPGEHCLWFQGTCWSRGALLELTAECERSLGESGFGEGMRLALALRNGPLFLAATLAAWKLGGAVVPVNPDAGPAAIRLLRHADVCGALVNEGESSLVRSLEAVGIPAVMASSAGPVRVFSGRVPPPSGTEPTETAVIFFTAGTTGRPKAVPLTHRNLLAELEGCRARVEGLVEEEVFLNALPNCHALGFVICGILPLWANFSQLLLPHFLPVPHAVEAMKVARVTVAPVVPTMISLLLGASARGHTLPSSLKLFLSGGDRVSPRRVERVRARLGIPILEGYGLTETSPVLAVSPSPERSRPGTVGLPIPGLECSIRNEEGDPLPQGKEGILWVRGPSIAESYWRDPALTAERFREGWFDTQDIARLDPEGYLTVVSRKSDVIVVGGFSVYPGEVEDVLLSFPQVREAAVVGVPRSLSGQAVKAFIVSCKGEPPNPRELMAYCRSRLPHYKVPRILEFLPELPRSSLGEVLKRELRDR